MTTTTRPILKSPAQKKLYVFKLTSFKKKNENLKFVVSAPSRARACAIARRRAYGFAYYLEAPQIFANKKAAQPSDCLKAQT